LAAERGATVVVVNVIEVPLDRPLDAPLPDEEEEAERVLDDAQAFLESYGVRAVTRLVRARRAGPAIVEEAASRNAELVIVGAPRQRMRTRGAVFGRTVDYVLKNAPMRVLVAAGKRAA
jgi:nucleotide-binding universal stress UspA family protein